MDRHDPPPAEGSYTVLPPLYDRFVSLRKSTYGDWLRYVEGLLRERRLQGDILSLGAGTAECEIELARAGHTVTCLDLSPAMLEIAREKAAAGADLGGPLRISFVQGDMRAFSFPRPFALVLCHYFAINYLLSPEDLSRCFRAAHAALAPGGVFAFDTIHNERIGQMDGQRTQRFIESPEATSLQEAAYGPGGSIRSELIVFYKEGDVYRKAREVHEQRVYPLVEMAALLGQAGFSQVERYAYATSRPPAEADRRVVFLATR